MKKLLFAACICFGLGVQGQINTDRPTQSYSPYVLPHGKVQTELGFVSERPVSSLDQYNVTYLNALVRVSVLKWMELRLTENYLGSRGGAENISGLSPTTLGAKFHLHDQTNALPQVGLLTSFTFANGQDEFKANESTQDIRLLFQHDLSDNLTLDYNIGTFWSASTDAVGIYTFMLGYGATDVISLFIEPYGFFGSGLPADNRVNGGATFLVSENFQADISGGFGLSDSSPDYFIGFGIGILF